MPPAQQEGEIQLCARLTQAIPRPADLQEDQQSRQYSRRVTLGDTMIMDATYALDNDTRGWLMCLLSGIACVVGASIICVDILVQLIPSKRDFRIQDSNAFLAASMSLSFGVMIFSALYSILPSSKKYLIQSDFSDSNAAWILLGCFIGGFGGIQLISKYLAHSHASNVVDCNHSHKDIHDHDEPQGRRSSHAHHHDGHENGHSHLATKGTTTESTPLLLSENGVAPRISVPRRHTSHVEVGSTESRGQSDRRQSMMEVPSRVMSYIATQIKHNCDNAGPCYGYSEPCGQECIKNLTTRTPISRTPNTFLRCGTYTFRQPLTPSTINGDLDIVSPQILTSPLRVHSHDSEVVGDESGSDLMEDLEAHETHHHHHVPENAFMNIGLQTSIAIAIHKIPEGFITYATNHANPSLGWSVFTALFFHNITEGFVLALPLYLALNSRLKAMGWAVIIGGVSQPLGAGVAAAWFKIAGHQDHISETAIYGCMFAVTAGVMASVALQLFVEGLSLNHNKDLCIWFAFLGMSIMGITNALTA